ncbi:MAG: hypothetical protein JW771_05155 [Candidatus Thermoplasmatota archaeon]|nr:hypothetical protein [Candidatus Thermoplasmatota archaeon]
MTLSYSKTTKELQVTLTHQVSDPNTHYIYQIVIKINEVITRTEEYTNQSGSSFTYTYEGIDAIEDDRIEVTATCNQGGSITKSLTVTAEDVSGTNEESSTPGFELIVLMISVSISVILLRKKR